MIAPASTVQRLLAAALAAAAIGGCSSKSSMALEPAATPVRVRTVEEQRQLAGAHYSGTVEAATRVDLAFRVGGYISALASVGSPGAIHKVQEGDWVKAGTVLAVVRESDYETQVAAGKAALAEALAASKQAQLDFDRAQKLLAENSIARAELDTQSARLDTAKARVEGAQARIREAQQALADCRLRAPIDGVVLKRPIEVGSLVSPGTLGFVVADTTSVKAVFGAPDHLVEKLKAGASLDVTFEAVPGTFTATISRIAPSADPKSRVFDIEATVPNPTDQLKVGMIAKLVVRDAALAEDTLVLPLTAVVRSPHDWRGYAAFVVESIDGRDKARVRDVKLGEVIGNQVIVTDGLKLRERVVSMGATLLVDGAPVRIIPG
jgi:multidrug efflux system membrane fusion protein